jgi:hypothetical protein
MDQTMNIQIFENKNQIKLLKKILTEQLSMMLFRLVHTQSYQYFHILSPTHLMYNELWPVSFRQLAERNYLFMSFPYLTALVGRSRVIMIVLIGDMIHKINVEPIISLMPSQISEAVKSKDDLIRCTRSRQS